MTDRIKLIGIDLDGTFLRYDKTRRRGRYLHRADNGATVQRYSSMHKRY